MTTTGADETVTQEITIKAPAKRIFEALTNPEQHKEWWGSEDRFQTTRVESDLRVGGKMEDERHRLRPAVHRKRRISNDRSAPGACLHLAARLAAKSNGNACALRSV